MKSKILILLVLSAFTFSCNSDDSSDDGGVASTSLPLNDGNYWTYNIYNHATADVPESFGRDSLYVENNTVINGITFKKMKTLNPASGFYSGFLKNNDARIDGSKVKVSGSLDFNAGLPVSIAFSVDNFIILKEGAAAGEELSNTSGSFVQTFDSYPLTFDYTLKSITDGTLNSYTSEGNTYSDITKTKVILNLKISTIVNIAGNNIPVPVMASQDVVVSTQYYSKNIGLVYNNTFINYSLNQLPAGVQLPFSPSGSQTQEEFLDTYLIN